VELGCMKTAGNAVHGSHRSWVEKLVRKLGHQDRAF